MSEILQRFEAIEEKAQRPYSAITPARQGNRIIFEQGKKATTCWTIGCYPILFGGLGYGVMAAQEWFDTWKPIYYWGFVLYVFAGIAWALFQWLRTVPKVPFFEIDPESAELVEYSTYYDWQPLKEPRRVALADIDYFLVNLYNDGDGISSTLYYVLVNGRAERMTHVTSGAYSFSIATLLGYLCDKSVYRLSAETPLGSISQRQGTIFRPTWVVAKNALLGVAEDLNALDLPSTIKSHREEVTGNATSCSACLASLIAAGFSIWFGFWLIDWLIRSHR